MIHPHLKTDKDLLAYWQGDFHDKDQMQALEQLARRKIGNFCDELKTALANKLSPEEIHWTYFEYIYDNAFVIDYVNNPMPDYNVEKAISYIEWAIPNDFNLSEYGQLSDKAKDKLLNYYIDKLNGSQHHQCDFVSYIYFHHHDYNQLETFEKALLHIINKGYLDFLEQSNDQTRLIAIEAKIVEMKNALHLSFIDWLYGGMNSSNGHSYEQNGNLDRQKGVVSSSVKSNAGYLFPIDISNYNLLEKLQNILKKEGLSLSTLPDCYISYEIPSVLRCAKENEFSFDTDKLLGYYIPSKQEIRLLEIGIQCCARHLNVDVDLLREIVMIHELGHYMQHKMHCYHTKEWDDVLYNASYSPIDLQEGWAQLMDAWVVKDEKAYFDVFNALVAVQSEPYKVYKNYECDSYRRILRSLDGLRQLDHPATTKNWDALL